MSAFCRSIGASTRPLDEAVYDVRRYMVLLGLWKVEGEAAS